MADVAPANEESTEAWSGPLFERWVRFRPYVVEGLGRHGELAMTVHPPGAGDRVLDIGCGFGDTTQRLAALVGEEGEAVGVDVSEPFVEQATEEAAEAGIGNVGFRLGDAQVADLGGPFDYVFSRMGVMFFANPVQALRNVRGAMRPGGRVCFVVWRRKIDNGWIHEAERVVERYLEHPEETEEPTCGPGPFSMADADVVTEQLTIAGFEEIELRRCDLPLRMGADLDEAVDLVMSIGPAGEMLRLWGDRADEIRPQVTADLRAMMAQFGTDDGIFASSSTWIVSAVAPG
ncbi:MAG TPA: methyltransferase domain-containing protein [Solirubrobacterales bacterium]|jgi:SAM-dependent methyltransferase|nr:methyltransferase domain-containing protein [Solirubrobacterales bacterium]